MKISTVIIAKDEASCIERCLKSVAPFSEEIVVVDTGSQDATRDIARRYTSRILDFKWVDDFSAARNFGLNRAAGDVIFSIDADEAVSEKDWPKFRELEGSIPEALAWAFSLPVRHYVTDEMDYNYLPAAGEYPEMEAGFTGYVLSFRPLIFPRIQDVFYEGAIHESVEKSVLRSKGRIMRISMPVHNFGCANPHSMEKNRTYEALLNKEVEKDPDDFKKNFDYAHYLFSQERPKEALPYMEKAYRLSGKARARVAYFQAALYASLGDIPKARALLQEIRGMKQPGVMYYLLQIALKEKNYDEALRLVREALRRFGDLPYFLQRAAEIYHRMGKERLSREYYRKLGSRIRKEPASPARFS